MATVMMVCGVVSFLLLLTPALQDSDGVTQKSANIGQRVELYFRREAKTDDNKIRWFKNDVICYEVGYKEDLNYEVILSQSHAILVILSMEEKDAGIYQHGSHLTNLTVWKISQNTSTESSDYKLVNLLQNILNNIFINRTYLITLLTTLLIGVGMIIGLLILKWCKEKPKQHQRNAGLQESGPLMTNNFKTYVDHIRAAQRLQQRVCEDIITKMVKVNDMESIVEALRVMKESNTKQSEDIITKMVKVNDMESIVEALRAMKESNTKQSEDIITKMVKVNDMESIAEALRVMKESITNQSEVFETLSGNVVSKIDKLGENVSVLHDMCVDEFKRLSKNSKYQDKPVNLKDIKELLQQFWPLDQHSISVTDAGLAVDG